MNHSRFDKIVTGQGLKDTDKISVVQKFLFGAVTNYHRFCALKQHKYILKVLQINSPKWILLD